MEAPARAGGGHAPPAASPLRAARVHRRLTVEEAAARAALSVEDVRCLEEGRIYRFPSVDRALAVALVYAAALGVSEREARRLAGVAARPERRSRRWLTVPAFAAAFAVLAWFTAVPELQKPAEAPTAGAAHPQLPPPWEVRVDVFNGTPVANAAARTANELAGPLAYRLGTVENAERLDYAETRVYYPPGSEELARRLADALGVPTTALPAGDDPNRLVVIVGRDRAS